MNISLQGTAYNAKLGAIIMVNDVIPIYLIGIEEWDSDVISKSIILHLKLLAPKSDLKPNGEISHGVDNKNYCIKNPIWNIYKK